MDWHPATIVTLVITGAFALAIMAVVLSKQSNTTGVLQTASQSLGSIITAAVSPLGVSSQNIGNQITASPTSQLV